MKIGLLFLVLSARAEDRKINAGAPPAVEPPGRNCQCSWSEWIDEDSPNSDKVDDERFTTLRAKGVDICDQPAAIQCWDKYMDIEPSDDVFCNARSGLYCDFLCPNYAIRVACCECVPPSIGTPFRLRQGSKCIMPGELKSKSKLYLKDDCDADSAHWQWGEDNVIKNFANEKLCVSATSEGNGQAIIMANCNQAATQQKWNSFFRGGYNVIEKQGTKLNLNHRERNGEIRLHRTAKSTSQFLALPKLSNMDKILNTEKVDLQVLMFKPCLELPSIDNAKWECTQYNLLYSQCKIKCNSGFKFIGDANARKICELYEDTKASDTKWSNDKGDPMGTCEPITCDAISEIENGDITCSGVGTESKCTFTCQTGYLLESSDSTIADQEYSVTCLASEQWSGPTNNIICSPIYCPSLNVDPTIIAECDSDNGSTNGVLVGSGCKFHCADEHATPQEGLLSEITCKMGPDGRTAQWDTTPEQFLVCKLLICTSIDEGDNPLLTIKYSNDVYYPDAVAEFQCPPGFILEGASQTKCILIDNKSDVDWSESIPNCNRGSCNEIMIPERAEVQCSTSSLFESECSMTCPPGYKISQENYQTSTCQSDLTWSNDLSDCDQMTCPKLEPSQYLQISCSSDSSPVEGTTCSFGCEDGYILEGETEVTCSNESWSGSVPKCNPVECPPFTLTHGIEICHGNSYGAFCELQCGEVAELIGPETITCQADGTWNADPVCKLITCAVPDELYNEMELNGCVRGEDMMIGQSCGVKCPEGKTSAVADLKCSRVDDGETNFSVQLTTIPSCVDITCDDRTNDVISDGGPIECSGNKYGDTCKYTCDEGFKLFGDETSTCTGTGWSTELPECRLARCIPKANPRNGAIICETDNRNRLVCRYKCNPGYLMNEGFNPVIKCKSSGKWSNEEYPICSPKVCDKLPSLVKTKYQCSDGNQLGSACFTNCRPGYQNNLGIDMFRCDVPDGAETPAWVDSSDNVLLDVPKCVPKTCDVIDFEITGGVLDCSDEFNFRSECDLQCNEGYTKINNNKLVCSTKNDMMTWDGALSSCLEIKCERPNLINGEFKCSDVNYGYGSTCSATCRNGFELQGNPLVTCSESGLFEGSDDEQEAYCHEIKCPPLANPDNGVITLGRGSETVNSTAELKCDEGYSVWTNPENPNGEHARTIKCGVNGEWENEAELINGSYKGDWIFDSNTNEYKMLSVCSERPLCPELDENLWFCQLHSQNRKRLCQSSCIAPRSLWKNTDNRYESMALNTNQGNVLSTTCTKDTWSSSKLEGWDPIQIHCISRCNEFIKKIENGRVECDHNNLINYSQKSSCTILCDEGYHITRNGESVMTNGNFTEKSISTCDGNDDFVDWNFSPINVTCEIIPPPESKKPIGGDASGDALKGDAGDTKAGAISGGIIGVLVLLVAVVFFLKYKKKKGGNSKKAADYTYSPAGGGDELDNLIPNKQRPLNLSRNSRHSGSFPISAIPENKLEEEYRSRMKNDQELMTKEFDSIPTTTHAAMQHASKQANSIKNRYRNVLPYDEHRVTLNQQPGDPFSDYINASFIDGYSQTHEFVAAQGPTVNTVADFWRMIWEREIQAIVMVTNLKEGAEEKCARYWSEEIEERFEAWDLVVTVKRIDSLAEFIIREMNVQHVGTGIERSVIQLHFTAWPDFGVPQNPIGMLKFIRKFNQIKRSFNLNTFTMGGSGIASAGDKPALVHCSAGVGRTGTFIALDYMMKQLEAEQAIDLPRFVNRMRSQRSYMVQTPEQYQFIYAAIVEHILFGNTEFEADDLNNVMEENLTNLPGGVNGFSHQFKKLDQLPNNKDQIRAANHALNMRKNRLLTILPFDYNRVVLPGKMGVEQSDYINASYIDGYASQRAYIATQAPLSDTTEDFWRMILKEKSSKIVMLTELFSNNEEKCVQYWPVPMNEWITYESIKVCKTEETEHFQGLHVTKRQFWVLKDGMEESFEVNHFQVHGWSSDGCPEEVTSTVELINLLNSGCLNSSTEENSTVVHCDSGAGPSGCFIGLANTISRLSVENIIDIFQTVKSLRTQRQHMVKSNDQYTFIFRGVQEWLNRRGLSSPNHSYSESYQNYPYLSSGN